MYVDGTSQGCSLELVFGRQPRSGHQLNLFLAETNDLRGWSTSEEQHGNPCDDAPAASCTAAPHADVRAPLDPVHEGMGAFQNVEVSRSGRGGVDCVKVMSEAGLAWWLSCLGFGREGALSSCATL